MGKRLFCLACVVVFAVSCISGVRASEWKPVRTNVSAGQLMPSKGRISKNTSPLVSAMFLILAGMGISMLFEKKE